MSTTPLTVIRQQFGNLRKKELVHFDDTKLDSWVITDEQKDLVVITADEITDVIENIVITTKDDYIKLGLLVNSIKRIMNSLELIKE